MQNGSLAVLCIQGTAKIGLISINYDTMHRQVAEDDSIDNSESPCQTEGGKCEQFKGEKQETETQSRQGADNTPRPPIVSNPMVMSNNITIADTRKNGSIDFFQSC